jgi:hypothetical protein
MSRHKLTWLTIILIALALFMTACGTTSKPPIGNKAGNLELVVQGVEQAQVMVAFDGKVIFDQVVQGSQKIESTVPVMNYKDTGTTRIALRANLPSPEAMQPGELKLSCIGVNCVPEEDYWYNCAYLDAENLNQPMETWNKDIDWTEYEYRPWGAEPLHHEMLENLRYGLRACASVKSITSTRRTLD